MKFDRKIRLETLQQFFKNKQAAVLVFVTEKESNGSQCDDSRTGVIGLGRADVGGGSHR